jgi:glutathione S-transferase
MNASTEFQLEVSRFIRAPRERVFEAFVTEAGARAWMCPRGLTLPEVRLDVRVGGRYRLTMRARDGETYIVGGTYREIVPPERLVYTWQWEGGDLPNVETLIQITLTERDGGTEVRMLHTGFPDTRMRDSHQGGWNSSLNRLVDALDVRGSAASVAILGDPRSTYVRTARMGLAEKGVKYTLEPLAPHTPEILAVHPFGRVPGFRDGDLTLFETSAILRYVQECFEGPSLLPGNIRDRARCEQWVSAINCYGYDAMIRRYVLQYIFPRGADGGPDRATIDGALKDIPVQLAIFDRAYGAGDYLAGAALSMADLFLAPILAYVEAMPEGAGLLSAAPNVRRAQQAIRARQSFRDTEPPRG